jgi:hypothetical protein
MPLVENFIVTIENEEDKVEELIAVQSSADPKTERIERYF